MTTHKLPAHAFKLPMLVVGGTGTGKSMNTAEQRVIPCLERKEQVVIIDPTDAWYGLRLSKSGKRSSGYDIAVFGGDNGDMPLTPNMGHALGELLGARPISAILSMQHFELDEQIAFMAAFSNAIMKTNRKPINLVIDEADEFIPQERGMDKTMTACRLRCKRIVTRGRKQGFRPVLITQRPQALDTSVRNLSQVLFALQCPGSHEREQIKEYVKHNGDPKALAAMLESLQGLQVGEAWVWIPREKVLERHKFGPLSVFDSFAALDETSTTVKVGKLDDKALAGVRAALASFEEERKANDPRELKAEIVELKKSLAAKTPKAAPAVPAPVVKQQIGFTKEQVQQQRSEAWELGWVAGCQYGHGRLAKGILTYAGQAMKETKEVPEIPNDVSVPPSALKITVDVPKASAQPAAHKVEYKHVTVPGLTIRMEPGKVSIDGLDGAEARVIQGLHDWKAMGLEAPTRPQTAFFARYTPGTGSFVAALKTLREKGLIEHGPGTIYLTDAGAALPVNAMPATSAEELQARIADRLDTPERKTFHALIARGTDLVSRPELAEAAGYTPGTGSFVAAIGTLENLQVIEAVRGAGVKLRPWIFLER